MESRGSTRRRRIQGEGSVYRTSTGRWRGHIDIPNSGGKRKWFSGATQREVVEKMQKVERDLEPFEAKLERLLLRLEELLSAFQRRGESHD